MSGAGAHLPAAYLEALIKRFAGRGETLALWGSYARGDAGPHSDVDLLRFADGDSAGPFTESHVVEGRLVTVATTDMGEVGSWFEQPHRIVHCVRGLARARALADPRGHLEAVRRRAAAFEWTPDLHRRADAWVGGQMVGWAEEVFKGLEGVRRDDPGRLLGARFGLSWGLSRVMVVHERLMLDGDNPMFGALAERLGATSRWVRLRDRAFGVGEGGRAPVLADQVRAGLALYRETAGHVANALGEGHREVVRAASIAIAAEIG